MNDKKNLVTRTGTKNAPLVPGSRKSVKGKARFPTFVVAVVLWLAPALSKVRIPTLAISMRAVASFMQRSLLQDAFR
jgi:hypothetical protein